MFDEIVKMLWMTTHMLRHFTLAMLSMVGAEYVIRWSIQLNNPIVAALSTVGCLIVVGAINLAYTVYWTSLLDDPPDQLDFEGKTA